MGKNTHEVFEIHSKLNYIVKQVTCKWTSFKILSHLPKYSWYTFYGVSANKVLDTLKIAEFTNEWKE